MICVAMRCFPRAACTGSRAPLEAARISARSEVAIESGACSGTSRSQMRPSAPRAGALMRLDEGAKRGVDPGMIAGPLPLEPIHQVGIEAEPYLLACRLGVVGLDVLVPVAGNASPVGVVRDSRLEFRLGHGVDSRPV